MVLSFPSLPEELKSSVFDQVAVQEAIKCLRTTKKLRHRVLNKGPFPSKIHQINFEFIIPESWIIYCEITIFSPSKSVFLIKDRITGGAPFNHRLTEPFVIEFPDGHSIQVMVDPLKFLNLFIKDLHSMEVLIGTNHTRYPSDGTNWVLKKVLEESRFLPNVFSIENLMIRVQNNGEHELKVFLLHFRPIVKTCFSLRILIDHPETRTFLQRYLRERPELRDCKVVVTKGSVLGDLELSEMNSHLVFDLQYSEEKFFERIQRFLEMGIPNRNPKAMVVLEKGFQWSSRSNESRESAFLRMESNYLTFLESQPLVYQISENSVEAMAIWKDFFEFPWHLRTLQLLGYNYVSSGENLFVFKRNYQMIRFFRKEFENSGKKAIILALAETLKGEGDSGRMRFVMRYIPQLIEFNF